MSHDAEEVTLLRLRIEQLEAQVVALAEGLRCASQAGLLQGQAMKAHLDREEARWKGRRR